MSKVQGYNKRLKSTTLRTFYNNRDSYEIVWDNEKELYVIFRNDEYLKDLGCDSPSSPGSNYGNYAFEIRSGYLFMVYDNGTTPPDVRINQNGELILTIV